MRPRVLYFAVFVFFSLSGGRFTATFLEHELQFTENWMISSAMAAQLLTSSICSSWLGGLADSWEASTGGKHNGRLMIMSLGLLLSTIATLLHSLGPLYMNWSSEMQQNSSVLDVVDSETDDTQPNMPLPLLAYHLMLRSLFAMGTAACMPVLDGLALAQLEREGRDKQEYGKERMYGAASWGIAHIILGPVIDRFGFKTLYATVILAFLGCVITFQMYTKSNSTNQYESIGVSDSDGLADISENEPMKTPDKASAKIQPSPKRKRYRSISFGDEDFFDDSISANTSNESNNENTQERLTFVDLWKLLLQKAPVLNISFMFSLFALYIGMSVVESLIFLYFEFLGGSNTMCGFTVVVTVMFELPLFHYAPDVLKLLGAQNMFQVGCFAYIVRVIGYSLIPRSHPYLVLFLEPLHGITIACAMTSSVAFADEWVPTGFESSGQGFMSATRSLGMFVGLCIAGFLEGRTLYRVLAVIVTVGSCVLAIGNYLANKPQSRKEEKQSKYTSL